MVSVVMIAYNSAKYIGQAIEGVVRQRCGFGIQLVICDDASTDSTAEIVADWSHRFPGVIDYHCNEKNLGIQANYLKAFSLCRGKYVALCDADDYWCCRTKLARQVAYMETHPECALTYHRVINYYEETGEMSLSNGGGMVERSAQGLASRNVITNMSVMYRAGLVDLQNLPAWLGNVRLLDYAMHMLFAQHGTVHYMNRPMGVYRQRSTAEWSLLDKELRMEKALEVRRNLIDALADRPDLVGPLEESCRRMIAAASSPESGRPAVCKRKLLSRCRAALSRLLPVPKP